jgi:uncharacterized protein YlxP (DUF503 family)
VSGTGAAKVSGTGGRGLFVTYNLCYTCRVIVSMLQIIFELEGITSIKDKRSVVLSLKNKLERRYHLTAAEVDLQDSLSFAQIGAALVSNSKTYGQAVMQKAFTMIENETPLRIADYKIQSEEF